MNEIQRATLIHAYPGYKLDEFLGDIDNTGGWPIGYKYVSFYHSIKHKDRVCKFGNVYLTEPYWTTVCSSDDYYWWKLSDNKKKEISKMARDKLIQSLRKIT